MQIYILEKKILFYKFVLDYQLKKFSLLATIYRVMTTAQT